MSDQRVAANVDDARVLRGREEIGEATHPLCAEMREEWMVDVRHEHGSNPPPNPRARRFS